MQPWYATCREGVLSLVLTGGNDEWSSNDTDTECGINVMVALTIMQMSAALYIVCDMKL